MPIYQVTFETVTRHTFYIRAFDEDEADTLARGIQDSIEPHDKSEEEVMDVVEIEGYSGPIYESEDYEDE